MVGLIYVTFNILQVIPKTIFLASHLPGAETQSSQPIAWLVLVNQIYCNQVKIQHKKQHKNYKKKLRKLNPVKQKPGLSPFMPSGHDTHLAYCTGVSR